MPTDHTVSERAVDPDVLRVLHRDLLRDLLDEPRLAVAKRACVRAAAHLEWARTLTTARTHARALALAHTPAFSESILTYPGHSGMTRLKWSGSMCTISSSGNTPATPSIPKRTRVKAVTRLGALVLRIRSHWLWAVRLLS